ncbi:MAG TPA: type VI secretion system baseplate subunit TssE [Candidatus Competibacteraceae bacterium]|nr:type VI secretion system baseplate subunit TssE [Candidatus Competibacteraceae bacterium]
MAKAPVLPPQASLLDRLLDDEPQHTREPPPSAAQALRALRQGVRRDLEHLLNARRRPGPLPAGLQELEHSLLRYGLPDFATFNLASAEGREAFRRLIEDTLKRCEPRFRQVRVQLLDNAEPLDRTLRFRIDALLNVEPAPEPIAFDSVLEPVSGGFALRGEGRDQ